MHVQDTQNTSYGAWYTWVPNKKLRHVQRQLSWNIEVFKTSWHDFTFTFISSWVTWKFNNIMWWENNLSGFSYLMGSLGSKRTINWYLNLSQPTYKSCVHLHHRLRLKHLRDFWLLLEQCKYSVAVIKDPVVIPQSLPYPSQYSSSP